MIRALRIHNMEAQLLKLVKLWYFKDDSKKPKNPLNFCQKVVTGTFPWFLSHQKKTCLCSSVFFYGHKSVSRSVEHPYDSIMSTGQLTDFYRTGPVSMLWIIISARISEAMLCRPCAIFIIRCHKFDHRNTSPGDATLWIFHRSGCTF